MFFSNITLLTHIPSIIHNNRQMLSCMTAA